MRTLQEKYNAIQEGKFSKDHFLAEARMQQPQFITRFNGYDDAVQILKNRGMIAEVYSAEEGFKDYSNDALADMIINLSKYEDNEDSIARVKAELERRKSTVAEISSDTFKSAVDVARGRGEDKRASKLGSTFLNSFVGKPLMGGTVSRIDIQKPSFGDYFDVTLEVLVPTQGTDGMYNKPKFIYYDVENDDWNMKGKGLEVTRQDARVLSQIATKVNPDTKYRQGTQHFDIVGMSEARMQQPQLITRFNGYDDAIQILKNRGMIQEAARVTSKSYKGLKYEIQYEAPKGYKVVGVGELEKAIGSPKFYKTSEEAKERAESDIKDYLGEKETVKEARLNNKSLTDYRYKVTNEMDKYPYEQILRGIRVELEVLGVFGTPTAEEYAKALAKVSKNLAKDSIFYTNQLAGVNSNVDLHDKMVDATAKNTVDTFNGMKKAELKEGFKKLIKKVLSEEEIDVESYKEGKEYEMYGEGSVDESKMGDVYLIAQEHDRFEHFVQAVEDEFGPVEDIVELKRIFNATRGEDGIDYGDENFSNSFIDIDSEEIVTDTEADKAMVRKLMAMYQTDLSKFEKTHKQAQVQAATATDIKFKHLLSLFNRAKAGALQRSTPEIPDFKGTRDSLDNLFESKSLKDLL